MRTCRRHYPGRSSGACSLVSLHCQRPSLCNSQVGSCNCFFGACSAFTRVTACTLAESPCDPFHRKLRQLRCLRCRFDCYRVERTSSRAGVAPAEVQRLFTAHYYVNYLFRNDQRKEFCSAVFVPVWESQFAYALFLFATTPEKSFAGVVESGGASIDVRRRLHHPPIPVAIGVMAMFTTVSQWMVPSFQLGVAMQDLPSTVFVSNCLALGSRRSP